MEAEADASTVLSSSTTVWTFEDEQRLMKILTQLKEGKEMDSISM